VWRLSSNLIFPPLSQRREKGRLMVEEVKRYRAEMNAMIQDLKDKQDRMQILNEEQAKLNKNINRCVCCADCEVCAWQGYVCAAIRTGFSTVESSACSVFVSSAVLYYS
jgi:hypothetical protein